MTPDLPGPSNPSIATTAPASGSPDVSSLVTRLVAIAAATAFFVVAVYLFAAYYDFKGRPVVIMPAVAVSLLGGLFCAWAAARTSGRPVRRQQPRGGL